MNYLYLPTYLPNVIVALETGSTLFDAFLNVKYYIGTYTTKPLPELLYRNIIL